MTPVATFAGKTVAVVGLGGSGMASAQALKAGGADVIASDDSAEKMTQAAAAGFRTDDLRDADWSKIEALVLAPGIPLTHPAPHWSVTRAKDTGVEVIGDIELFCRERQRLASRAPFIAITGTNGKSTTTALIAHLLASAGKDVQVGGNLGTPILSLSPPALDRFHVVEMSSYQIDLTPSLAPSVGILLNVSPDHLDRHGTMERYAAIKASLVERAQTPIVGVEDAYGRAVAEKFQAQHRRSIAISTQGLVREGYVAGTTHLYRVNNRQAEEVADLAGIGSLRGAHNAQNALAAFAACAALGIDDATIRAGLETFPGLAHRMQEVRHKGKVLFVNDSKATNADSAARALSSFENIYWIAGGRAKEGGIADLAGYFPRIRKAYLIGEAAPDFARFLDGKIPYEIATDLERAVASAASDAAQGEANDPVVLLSPACASFDQFRNFEIRGDRFSALVAAL